MKTINYGDVFPSPYGEMMAVTASTRNHERVVSVPLRGNVSNN